MPRLHVVTDDAILARDGWPRAAAEVLEAAGPAVALHVRGPSTSGRALCDLVVRLRGVARAAGAVLIVNDRVDVALVTGVDGVHLGARSLSVAHARAILGGGGVVGASLHRPEEIGDARAKGADYAFVGTIFPTPTHPGVEGMGADGIARAVAVAGGLPCLGIGGIDVARVRDVVRAGAHGVAVVRGVWLHSRPASAVTEYLAALEDAHV